MFWVACFIANGFYFACPRAQVRVCRATAGDEVLLACDGLWDVFSAVRFVCLV